MLLALTTDDIKVYALVAMGVVLVIGIVAALVIKAVVGRLLTLVLMVALVVVVWTQRTSISNCAKDVKAAHAAGSTGKTTCRFFGRDIKVEL